MCMCVSWGFNKSDPKEWKRKWWKRGGWRGVIKEEDRCRSKLEFVGVIRSHKTPENFTSLFVFIR